MDLGREYREYLLKLERELVKFIATGQKGALMINRKFDQLKKEQIERLREIIFIAARTASEELKMDMNILAEPILSGFTHYADEIDSEVKRILRKGLPTTETKNNIKKAIDAKEHIARTLALTGTAGINQVKRISDALDAGFKYFKYIGAAPERKFCKIHYNKIYTVEEILKLDNGTGRKGKTPLPPLYFGGGYNCRHIFAPVIKADEKPKPLPPEAKAGKPRKPRAKKLQEEAKEIKKISKLTPKGSQVSAAYQNVATNQKVYKNIEEALRIIDSIHGDGDLKYIPIYSGVMFQGRKENKSNDGGCFLRTAITGEPLAILCGNRSKIGVAFHEIGHHLDRTLGQMNKSRGLETERPDGNFSEILEAIKNSKAAGLILKNYTEARHRRMIKYFRYLGTNKELFARAYAQFIATEAGLQHDDALGFEKINYEEEILQVGSQWRKEDFEPIRKAFINAFKKIGWLK